MRFQDLLTLYHEYFSTFHHSTSALSDSRSMYGWKLMSPRFKHKFQCALLRNSVHLSSFFYGTITLYRMSFQTTSNQKSQTKNRSYNTTSPNCFQQDSVCRLLCSLAVTNSISIDFLSFGY